MKWQSLGYCYFLSKMLIENAILIPRWHDAPLNKDIPVHVYSTSNKKFSIKIG